jgi:hypothetical protein
MDVNVELDVQSFLRWISNAMSYNSNYAEFISMSTNDVLAIDIPAQRIYWSLHPLREEHFHHIAQAMLDDYTCYAMMIFSQDYMLKFTVREGRVIHRLCQVKKLDSGELVVLNESSFRRGLRVIDELTKLGFKPSLTLESVQPVLSDSYNSPHTPEELK